MQVKRTHTIVIGDPRQMRSVPDRSVHLVVTSPPQFGSDDSFEEYIRNLSLIWGECYRVLDHGGRVCIQVTDLTARSTRDGGRKLLPLRAETIRSCEIIGLDYMGGIVCRDRVPRSLSGRRLTEEMQSDSRDWVVSQDCIVVLVFRKPGRRGRVSAERKEASKMTDREWKEFFHGHWSLAKRGTGNAAASTRREIARRCIRMFSFVGNTVLDPFLRHGTTIFAAYDCRRSFIGYSDQTVAQKVITAASLPGEQAGRKKTFQIIVKEDSREPSSHPERLALAGKAPRIARRKSSSRAGGGKR